MKIKRSTINGIIETEVEEGYFVEIQGYKFAFINTEQKIQKYLIELSTGHNAYDSFGGTKKREFTKAINFVKRVSKQKLDEVIKDAMIERGYTKPLNEPI